MNSRLLFKSLAFTLAAVLSLLIFSNLEHLQPASANNTRSQISTLKEERQEIERRAREVQQRIDSLEFERLSTVAKRETLADRIALTELEIANTAESIDYTYMLIEEKEVEVADALQKEEDQLDLYKTRVRSMEENGAISYLEVLLDSGNFADLLARIDFIGDIMRADDAAYHGLIEAKRDTIVARNSLEDTKVELEKEKAQLEQSNFALEQQVREANALIIELMAIIDTEQELYDEEMSAADAIQREINAKEAELRRQEQERRRREAEIRRQQEQERRQQEAEKRVAESAVAEQIKGTGKLTWPLPGNVKVSSPYGTRVHPVFKVSRMHHGADIPAPTGRSIVASDTGTVITSEYNSTYGHYVVISHGNGMTTLYAHMSSRGVKVGDEVTKGDTIGRVGSTGVSTGPHLHFEIAVDGLRYDPLSYFSGWVADWD